MSRETCHPGGDDPFEMAAFFRGHIRWVFRWVAPDVCAST